MRNKKVAVSIVSLLACLAGSAVFGAATSYATPSITSANLQEFKLQPAVDLWGYSGNNTLGEGQVRLPIYGDSSKVFYGLAEGNTAINNNSWLGGGGLGYRQVVNNERIFGGYALLDYSNITNNSGFWVANPGLEMLGQTWDMNINGYIPFVSKKTIGSNIWADDLIGAKGIDATDYIYFWEHKEGAHKFKVFEEMGNGFGAEIGRVIPSLTKAKLYVGGYHFDTDDIGSINGVTARLTYGLNKYTALELKNTYDNVNHNKTLFGFKLSFGGYSDKQKQEFGISSRLMDPVDNDFARLNAGVGAVVKTKYVDQGDFLEHDNLWFFEPAQITKSGKGQNSDLGDGTYEHPFIGLIQDNYNKINASIGSVDKNPLMYFAPGSYAESGVNNFTLNNGWGMYGRTSEYKAPAMEDNRPIFDYIIEVAAGNEQSTLNSISINPDVTKLSNRSPLFMSGASNVVLQNIYIQGGAGLDVIDANNSTLNFEAINQSMDGKTTIDAGSNGGNGIYIENNSIINFNGGVNIVNGGSKSANYESDNGIYLTSGAINFKGGTNTITGGSSEGIQYSNNGIYVHTSGNDNSVITFAGGTNVITGGSGYSNDIDHNGIVINAESGNSVIDFIGGSNQITGGIGSGNMWGDCNGIGIVSLGSGISTINFIGGVNHINGGAITGTSNYIKNEGIYAVGAGGASNTINFNGGTNIITGGSGAGDSNGIVAGGVTIAFNGGDNTIQGGTSVKQGSSVDSNGIMADYSTIIFAGGTNKIIGGSGAGSDRNSNGIYAFYSKITFSDGVTTITGGQNNDANSSNSNGVYAAGLSCVTFANVGKPSVNIVATQDGANGIYADATSTVQYMNDQGNYVKFDSSNIKTITNYATFTFLGDDSSSSNAVYWDQNSPATPISLIWPTSSKVAAK